MPWFEYSATPSGSKPLVAVHLWYGSRQVRLVALVDSGADSSLLDIGYAGLLGLTLQEAQKSAAVAAGGNEIEIYNWPPGLLDFQFEGQRFPFSGSFAEFSSAGGMNLLGRRDFFAPFIIQFWDAQGLMNIDLSPDFPRGDPMDHG